jgi:hypothetical protein
MKFSAKLKVSASKSAHRQSAKRQAVKKLRFSIH